MEALIPGNVLPKPLLKHIDSTAPLPLRMMGAKGLVPAVAPADLVCLLYFLSADLDPTVVETAIHTAAALPERVFGVALREERVEAPVLDWLADRFIDNELALELLLLNANTDDLTVARLAGHVSEKLTAIVRQNELRLLRHDDIIRNLCSNSRALVSTLDGACDFCVRNGLVLLDVPPLVEAYKRIYGVAPAAHSTADGETAAALMAEYQNELVKDQPEVAAAVPETPEEELKKMNMTQRILKMTVSQKIKLATLGNKEARTILLRDSNKLVCMASATSPRITEREILGLATSKTCQTDVLRYIFTKRDFIKNYGIKTALVKNPKVPLPTALKLMLTLQEKDIKDLSRDRNVPQTIQAQARSYMQKKEQAAKSKDDRH